MNAFNVPNQVSVQLTDGSGEEYAAIRVFQTQPTIAKSGSLARRAAPRGDG